MLVLIYATTEEIPEFRCASSGMTLLTRTIIIPANAGIYTLFCGKEAY